jgi:hypothetical protein
MQLSSNIRRPQALQGMNQPSKLGSGNQLVFIYPILYDDSLRRYVPLIRQFLSVDFISQIKISNVLNITYDATRVGTVTQGNNQYNPAELVRRTIFQNTTNQQFNQIPQYTPSQFDLSYDKSLYQERINSTLNFVKNQIQHNPRYSQYMPMLSSITVENLINIPLIVGTKDYPVNNLDLFFIILAALATGSTLNREANLSMIERSIDAIPSRNYIRLLNNSDAAHLVKSSGVTSTALRNLRQVATTSSQIQLNPSQWNRISQYIRANTSKTFQSFRNVLNERTWRQETDNLTTTGTLSINDIPVVATTTQRKHMSSAAASFQSYMSYILPQFGRDIEVLLGPVPTTMNFQLKISTLVDEINENITRIFEQYGTNIAQQIFDTNLRGEAGVQAAVTKMGEIKSICQINTDVGADIEKQLNTLNNNHIPPMFSKANLSSFMRAIGETGTFAAAGANRVEQQLNQFITAGTNLLQVFRSTKQYFTNIVNDFFYSDFPRGNGVLVSPQYPVDLRYPILNAAIQNLNINVVINIVNEIRDSLINLIYFLFLYNLISYLCMYMQDVDVEIETQQRDALEFPNFCLVVPFDVINGFYTALQARNFKRAIYARQEPIQSFPDLGQYTINNYSAMRVILQVSNRLGIPNIIVIDEKTNTVYYKFMYMQNINMMKLNTLQSYVNHQADVLPGF